MAQYGSPRLTGDVDVIVSGEEGARMILADAEDLSPLSFGGYRAALGAVEVDVIVRADKYKALYTEALDAANELPGAETLYLVGPEHLAAMKLAAGRGKDVLDLEYLLATDCLGDLYRPLDVERARDIVDRHLGSYGADVFDGLVEDAVLLRKNPQRRARLR